MIFSSPNFRRQVESFLTLRGYNPVGHLCSIDIDPIPDVIQSYDFLDKSIFLPFFTEDPEKSLIVGWRATLTGAYGDYCMFWARMDGKYYLGSSSDENRLDSILVKIGLRDAEDLIFEEGISDGQSYYRVTKKKGVK